MAMRDRIRGPGYRLGLGHGHGRGLGHGLALGQGLALRQGLALGLGLVALGTAPAAQAQHEDTLSAKKFSAPALLAEGYRVVAYEVVDKGESRLILKQRYKLALCVLEESFADEESLEIESTCYRLR